MTEIAQNNQISWKRIVLFFIIATVISNIFRFDIFELQGELKKLPTWLFLLTSVLLEGSGVIIGALIAIPYLKKQRAFEMSIYGTSKAMALVIAVVPIIVLTVIGVRNEFGMEKHAYGLIAIAGTLLYCIMEEYGWRGYLQEELKFLIPWQKYVLIGAIWYLWHLSFLTEATFKDNAFFLAMMIFGSWGIGQVAESTKSILIAACFHLIVQIMMFNALFRGGITGTEKIIILVVCIASWAVIMKKWRQDVVTA